VCGEPKSGLLVFSNAFFVAISLVCKLKVEYLTPNVNETQNFLGELIIVQKQMVKKKVGVLKPFLSFLVAPQTHKTHNMLAFMLDFCFKRLGLVIQYVGKEKVL
jgi:hypothetical protein